jgi:hypothetical protein
LTGENYKTLNRFKRFLLLPEPLGGPTEHYELEEAFLTMRKRHAKFVFFTPYSKPKIVHEHGSEETRPPVEPLHFDLRKWDYFVSLLIDGSRTSPCLDLCRPQFSDDPLTSSEPQELRAVLLNWAKRHPPSFSIRFARIRYELSPLLSWAGQFPVAAVIRETIPFKHYLPPQLRNSPSPANVLLLPISFQLQQIDLTDIDAILHHLRSSQEAVPDATKDNTTPRKTIWSKDSKGNPIVNGRQIPLRKGSDSQRKIYELLHKYEYVVFKPGQQSPLSSEILTKVTAERLYKACIRLRCNILRVSGIAESELSVKKWEIRLHS